MKRLLIALTLVTNSVSAQTYEEKIQKGICGLYEIMLSEEEAPSAKDWIVEMENKGYSADQMDKIIILTALKVKQVQDQKDPVLNLFKKECTV